MNQATGSAVLASVGGEALWRTNPVLCVDRLIAHWNRCDASWAATPGRLGKLLSAFHEQGVRLPFEALTRWTAEGHISPDSRPTQSGGPPAPRVIGLAVGGSPGTGYVFPLHPAPCGQGWRIDHSLPFLPEDIQNCLAGLLHASGMGGARGVPERLAFVFDNPTGATARGDSMTIAATFAVLDQMQGRSSPLFRAVVALVELQPGGLLGPVSNIPVKLAAASREYGELSLIVCAPGLDNDCRSGVVVWEVNSLADLAGHLHRANLLAPILDAVGALSRAEAARMLDRLRGLVLREHRYRDAADLGERARRCGFAHPPDPAVWVEFARLHAQACRHHGRFGEAVSVSKEAHKQVADLGDLGCDDEEADAAVEYAAGLFSGHRFADIPPLLESWAEAATQSPRRFRSLTRVKVWNTLGRALAILGQKGWDELFGRSITLFRQLDDPENIDRTTHYRVHARLRHGDTAGAREALEGAPGLGNPSGTGSPWVAFLHANLARVEGREWVDQLLDERLTAGEKPYPAWLYAQATARQVHREREEALARLRMAISLLKHEAGGIPGNVCNLFVSFLEMNAAARSDDAGRWAEAIGGAHNFLSHASEHREYYGQTLDALPSAPDLSAAEALLNRVPYF